MITKTETCSRQPRTFTCVRSNFTIILLTRKFWPPGKHIGKPYMFTCTLPARVLVCFFQSLIPRLPHLSRRSFCISEELCTIERNKWKGVGQEESLIGSAYYFYYTCIKQYTCIRDVKTTSWTIQETQISSVSFIFSYPRNIPRTVNTQRAVEWVAQQRRQKRNLLIS